MSITTAPSAPQLAPTQQLPNVDENATTNEAKEAKVQSEQDDGQAKVGSTTSTRYLDVLNKEALQPSATESLQSFLTELPPERVDLAQVKEELRRLTEAMGSDRPVATPAQQFQYERASLDTQPKSILDLITFKNGADGCYPQSKLPDAKPIRLALDKLADIDVRVAEKRFGELTAPQQQALSSLTAAVKSPFVQQVVAQSLRSQMVRVSKSEASASVTALPPITIPDSTVVDFEKTFARGLADFPSPIDVDALAQIVMMGCAKDAELDLREMLKEMQVTNRKRATMRTFMTAQKKEKARMEEKLRAEYDARCSLPKKDDRRIEPELTSFDDYKQSQKLVRYGEIGRDDDGMPVDNSSLGVSPNITLYPQIVDDFFGIDGTPISQDVVDQAEKLNVSPVKLQQLLDYWNNNVDVLSSAASAGPGRFSDFESFLLAPVSTGGVGLCLGSSETQDAKCDYILTTRHPDYLESILNEGWGLSTTAAAQLVRAWEDAPASYKAMYPSFESWLTEGAPFGPGLTHSADAMVEDAKIAAFCGDFPNYRSCVALAREFHLNPSDTLAAYEVYKVEKNGAGSFSEFLTKAGCKAEATGEENRAALMTSLEAAASPGRLMGTPEYATWEEARRNFETWKGLSAADKAKLATQSDKLAVLEQVNTSIAKATEHLTQSAEKKIGDYTPLRNAAETEINAIGEILRTLLGDKSGLFGEIRQTLSEMIGACAKLAWMRNNGWDAKDTTNTHEGRIYKAVTEALTQFQAQLQEQIKDAGPLGPIAQAYATLQLQLAQADEKAMVNSGVIGYEDTGWINPLVIGHFRDPVGATTTGAMLAAAAGAQVVPVFGQVVGLGTAIAAGVVAIFGELTDLNHFVDPNLKGAFDDIWMSKKDHESLAGMLGDTSVTGLPMSATSVPIAGESIGGLTRTPGEPGPPPVPPQPWSQKAVDAQAALGRARGIAANITAGPRHAVTSTIPPFSPDAAFLKAVKELKTKNDRSIKQRDRIDLGDAKELTIGTFAAEVEGYQAQYDTLGDMSQEQSLKMQMYMDRRAKFYETLSNMMKKVSQTSSTIIGNMK